jgi:PAS domain S-box-containing protein
MTHQTYTLLIVEDAPTDRELYRRLLLKDSNCDYEVLEAESLVEGLEFCQQRFSRGEATPTIHAILLDYQLPDGDGLEFLAELAAQSHGKLPPVVMLTGQGDENIAVRAMKLGAQDYLLKRDLTPELLQATIRNAISRDRFRQQLAQSEDRFRASIDNMLDCVGIYSAIRTDSGKISDFRIDYLNPAAFANSRMTTADIGKRLCEEFTSLRETGLFIEYCQVIETGTPLVKEDLIYTDVFGGELLTRVYDLRFSKLNDGLICAWRDITDRKQIELARIAAERDRDRFFNLSIDLLAIANFEGYFLRLNPAWEKVLGFSTAELMARPFVDFVHPDDLATTLAVVKEICAGTAAIEFENRYRCQDGSYRWLLWNAMPDAEQNVIYAIAHDITDRKQNEAALQASERKFGAIFDQTFELLGLLSLEGVVLELNQTALKSIDARSESEIIGKLFWETPWWNHSPLLQAQLQQAILLAAGGKFMRYEMQYPSPSGDIVDIDFSLQPVFDDAGLVVTLLAEGHDITERQTALRDRNQTQADLEQRNRELDSFVYTVSQDLKAPLRAVSNLSGWIEEDLGDTLTTANQAQMSLLRSRVHRMESTIDGLIDYARLGRTDDKNELVVVAQLLTEVIDSLAPPPTFTITIAPNLPTLYTKRLLMFQVFANLIGNAIEHHDRLDGTIHLGIAEGQDFYEFSVSDDGPGIEPEHHDKIFKIFEAVNPQKRSDSTGIGLAIVTKIVEAEGGTVRLESQIAKGTTFYFTWPQQ